MIFGRAHSGKTRYISDIADKLFEEGKPLVILVPEQFTHLAEKRLISRIGSIIQGKAEILSFARLAKFVNSEYPSTRKKINSIARSLIMSEVIGEAKLNYYKNISLDTGFIDECINEISEFKKYNFSCDDVFMLSKKVSDKGLSLKLSDLAEVYSKYEEVISSSYADSDDELGILAENLEKYSPYKDYTFIFDEFSSFNPIEKRIISALSAQCENVYMTFCCDMSDKYKYLFKPTIDTSESVKKVCLEKGCVVSEPVILESTYYNNDEISFLEKNIFSFPADRYEGKNEYISVFTPENPHDEITEVACKIKKLVSENNIRYKDISIVCSDISSYSHIFRSVFSSFDIPYFVDEKTSVLKHSIVYYVVNILDVYLSGYSCEAVTNFLKSGYISAKRSEIIDCDNFINATNASKNTWLIDEKWKKTLELYSEDDALLAKNIENVRKKYILPLAKLHDSIKGKNSVKFISEEIYKFLMNSGFDKRVSEYIEFFKSENNIYMAKQYESVWKVLIDTLDMLVFVLGDKKINLSDYRKYLYTALSEQKIGIIPTSVDAVVIGDIKRSKSEFSICQFVVGVYDGVFPAPSKGGCIITDADKKKISDAGYEFSVTSGDSAYFDRFLIYSCLTHPTERLYISYPLSDFEYKATRPSFTLTLLERVFKNINISSTVDSLESKIATEKNALEFLSKSAYLISEGESPDERWKDVYSYFVSKGNSDAIKSINSYIAPSEPVIKLNKELMDRLFKDEFYSSISRIQKYNSCRYLYYLEYMLGLSEKKSFEPAARDIGNFVHSLLEMTFKKMEADGVKIEDTDKSYFENLAAPLFEEHKHQMFAFSDELSEGEKHKFEICKKLVISALMNIRSHLVASAFRPIGHEIVFSDDSYGTINIKLDNGKTLKITGKIDRADSFENENGTFLRVVDYKTGNKSFDLSQVYHGLDVQLIVYLNTLVKSMPHSHHAGALYFRIYSPLASFDGHPDEAQLKEETMSLNAMTGLIADEEDVVCAYSPGSIKKEKKATLSQFEALSSHVETVMKHSAESMSEGYIEINPYELGRDTACDKCVYASVCGVRYKENHENRKLSKYQEKSLWKLINSERNGE